MTVSKVDKLIRVSFLDFWPGFESKESLFWQVLNTIHPNLEIVRRNADIEIHSVFGDYQMKNGHFPRSLAVLGKQLGLIERTDFVSRSTFGYRSRKKRLRARRVWFTTERRTPPYGQFDLTLSFDPTSNVDNNIYFPFWMYRLDWGFGSKQSEISPTPVSLTQARLVDERPMSAVMFSSNLEPLRLELASLLGKHFPVARYGLAFDKPIQSKIEASRSHLFQICPENMVSPGYVTEKLIEAWVCECVPVWSGGMNDARFNSEAFIDITGLSPSDAVSKVISYSTKELREIREQPLLKALPSLESLTERFRLLVSS
jgi:hypothetical protein